MTHARPDSTPWRRLLTQRPKLSRSSCSQKRITVNPRPRKRVAFRVSRSRFRVSFSDQNDLFVLGTCPHEGQPCQKHPSTNTASICAAKTKSGLPGSPFGWSDQPDTPARTSAKRRRCSVVRLPRPRTALMRRDRAGVTPTNSPRGSVSRSDFSTLLARTGARAKMIPMCRKFRQPR